MRKVTVFIPVSYLRRKWWFHTWFHTPSTQTGFILGFIPGFIPGFILGFIPSLVHKSAKPVHKLAASGGLGVDSIRPVFFTRIRTFLDETLADS